MKSNKKKTENEIFNQILLWATSYRVGVNPLAIAQKGATIENILDLIYQKGIEHGYGIQHSLRAEVGCQQVSEDNLG